MAQRICNFCDELVPVKKRCGCRSREGKVTKSVNTTRKFYEKARPKILVRDKLRCVKCWLIHKKVTAIKLQIHHIKNQQHYKELAFEPRNLITLCEDCHDDYDGKDYLDFDYEHVDSH